MRARVCVCGYLIFPYIHRLAQLFVVKHFKFQHFWIFRKINIIWDITILKIVLLVISMHFRFFS